MDAPERLALISEQLLALRIESGNVEVMIPHGLVERPQLHFAQV
jgi:hypothetical protein